MRRDSQDKVVLRTTYEFFVLFLAILAIAVVDTLLIRREMWWPYAVLVGSGLPGIVAWLNFRVVFDNETLSVRSEFRVTRSVLWDDIWRVRFSDWRGLLFETMNGQRVRVFHGLHGARTLIDFLTSRLPVEVWQDVADELLQIRNGRIFIRRRRRAAN